jgi:adenylate cyclase
VIEAIPYLIVGLIGFGMGVSFFAADPRSPTSRALSLMWCLLGLAAAMNIPAAASRGTPAHVWLWERLYSIVDPAIIVCGLEWVLRIGRTQAAQDKRARAGELLLRVAQALACLYGAAGLAFPESRAEVWATPRHFRFVSRPEFYLFAIPFNLSGLLGAVRVVQLLRADTDRAEKVRLVTLVLATPAFASGYTVPDPWRAINFAIGEVIFLVGAIRYHVLQGQRSQFLARFLSPQLARLVSERGLASTMQRSRVELSVVACDLRGFTAFAETGAPEEVMKLLEEYYEVVGEVVSRFGGSIKDFAGDGILALVGAPIPYPDHAPRALAMALEIRDRGDAILSHWRSLGVDLGLGVGVASGFVTVGTIGSGRLEYAAVGPAVNLASRLASRAEAGQVLAEPHVVGLAGDGGFRFEKLESAELKGFARPVVVYSVSAASRGPALTRGVA